MNDLRNKKFNQFSYTSRYTSVPYFYNKRLGREWYGIGEQMLKNNSWVAHKVTSHDSLDKLALTYYNNPTYWWVIAYFNDITDPFIKLIDRFEILKIPQISGIAFGELR